jgi:PE family
VTLSSAESLLMTMERLVIALSLALAAAGCAGGASTTPFSSAPLATAARPANVERPLKYTIVFGNRLAHSLHFTVRPENGAGYTGESSFRLDPHRTVNAGFTIPAYAPGRFLSIEARDGFSSGPSFLADVGIDGSRFVCNVHMFRSSLVGVSTEMYLESQTSAILYIDAKPAQLIAQATRREPAAQVTSVYKVALSNALKTGVFDVDVVPGSATLEGPSEFVLDPKASETIASSDPTSAIGDVERIKILEATTGQERASIGIAAAGDEVSASIAALFGSYGQQYQSISAEAVAFHDQFVATVSTGASAYQGGEALAR